MKFSLDNKGSVNPTTFFVSILARILVFVGGVALIAAGTPVSFGSLLLVFSGAVFVYGSRSITLTFRD